MPNTPLIARRGKVAHEPVKVIIAYAETPAASQEA